MNILAGNNEILTLNLEKKNETLGMEIKGIWDRN